MGWFWADAAAQPVAVHRASGTPPPSCPMHNKTATSQLPAAVTASAASTPAACPYEPPTGAASSTPSYVSKLNPLNYIPSNLSNKRDSTHQKINLPQEREESTIPRGDGAGLWEYPSPQQMYNAMLRKGYTDTPAEHVEAMVAVHNFLNEGAWEEIKGWEARFSSGLYKGSELCLKGEEGADRQMALDHFRGIREKPEDPKLVRFMGRPKEPSPKARMMSFLAWIYPSQFPDNPPFDRHDWYVQRQLSNGTSKEVRYVIDYYSGPPEPTGEPVFYLDVRPALDGPTAACERLLRWGGDTWYKASGASVREQLERQRA